MKVKDKITGLIHLQNFNKGCKNKSNDRRL
jgi:hypothetical protein